MNKIKNRYELLENGDVVIYVKRYGKEMPLIYTCKEGLEKAKEWPNTWCVDWNESSRTNYAYSKRNGVKVYFHQYITGAPKGTEVNHLDFNGLNDRLSNLKVGTKTENLQHKHDKTQPRIVENGMTGVFLTSIKKDETVMWGPAYQGGVNLGYSEDIAETMLRQVLSSWIRLGICDEYIISRCVSLGHSREYVAAMIASVRKALNIK